MSDEGTPSKHVCLCGNPLASISLDPELDMITALADKNTMTLIRGLSKEGARSPFPDGLFGLTEKETSVCMRKLNGAGLICSNRDGADHIYTLNKGRFRDLGKFINGLIE